jgi:polyisoprenyl-teichoic acid--peptidoglycan teichoic acid transferase
MNNSPFTPEQTRPEPASLARRSDPASFRAGRFRAARRFGLVVVASVTALALTAPADSVSAASKTTKRKVVAKKKTTTTKRRKAPAPAKGAKRVNGLYTPNGRPPVAPLNFDPNPPSKDKTLPSAKNETEAYTKIQADGKVFTLLIVGTDARPGEKPDRTRGDAIHIFSYNPTLKQGSIIGFPRDSYVTMTTGDKRKLTEVMSVAGPAEFLATMNKLTGLKVERYILTGFDGFRKMVDGVGGVNVQIKPKMNDVASGAQFQEGWFQFNGNAALAFSRARKTIPNGDFGRSANQQKLMLASFSRLRESTDNIQSLLNWTLVIRKNTMTNMKPGDLLYYAQVARFIDPATIKTKVINGVPDNIGGSEVIVLDEAEITSTVTDLQDGVLGN